MKSEFFVIHGSKVLLSSVKNGIKKVHKYFVKCNKNAVSITCRAESKKTKSKNVTKMAMQ